ncbi:MAG: hypothetical protein JW881_19895 [Spirochaetales bacterium]|nr:hypothetical protein [Spirochaetales bacterium]
MNGVHIPGVTRTQSYGERSIDVSKIQPGEKKKGIEKKKETGREKKKTDGEKEE